MYDKRERSTTTTTTRKRAESREKMRQDGKEVKSSNKSEEFLYMGLDYLLNP